MFCAIQLPSTEFPKEWDITYNAKHWSNEITMLQYIDKILLPYIYKKGGIEATFKLSSIDDF